MPKGVHPNHVRGSAHHRWNSGAIVSEDGYRKIRVGVDHPLADPNGYAYEHVVIWVSAGKRRPGPGELLHHVNDDRADNRIENLELKTRSDHNAHHLAADPGRRDAITGRFA